MSCGPASVIKSKKKKCVTSFGYTGGQTVTVTQTNRKLKCGKCHCQRVKTSFT